MSPKIPVAASPAHEIVSRRVVNASQSTVYKAWTDPEWLKVWWGPAGFTNTFHSFDLRVGGRWSFVMHGPEKGNYVNECEFTHIDPPKLIAWKRHSQPLFKVLATFEEVAADQTQVTFRQLFDTEKECNKLKPFVVDKNEENFDRLEVVLESIIAGTH